VGLHMVRKWTDNLLLYSVPSSFPALLSPSGLTTPYLPYWEHSDHLHPSLSPFKGIFQISIFHQSQFWCPSFLPPSLPPFLPSFFSVGLAFELGVMLAKQVLYHLSHTSGPFCYG
jgi:hypothetical protein